MSRSRLPPEPGQIPAKVIFAGVDEGSEEAENLYNQYRGQIARFHHRARQSAHLSDLPQVKLQGRLDGDIGTAHYIRNNGMETITVQLTNEIVVEARPEPEIVIPKPEQENPKWLVIDVIIDPRTYQSMDLDQLSPPAGGPVIDGNLKQFEWEVGVAVGVQLADAEPVWAHNCLSWSSVDIVVSEGNATVTVTHHPDVDFGGRRYADPLCSTNYVQDGPGIDEFPGGLILADPPITVMPYIPDGSIEGPAVYSFLVNSDTLRGRTAPVELKVHLATAYGFEAGILLENDELLVEEVDVNYTPRPQVRYHIQVREMSSPPAIGYTTMLIETGGDISGAINVLGPLWNAVPNLVPVHPGWIGATTTPVENQPDGAIGTVLTRSGMRVTSVSALGGPQTRLFFEQDFRPTLAFIWDRGILVGDMTPEIMTHTDTITWTPPVDRTSGAPAQVSIKQH